MQHLETYAMKAVPLFRNDDVAVDSDTAKLAELCAVFHDLGHRIVHGVTLYGLCNYAHTYQGQHAVYPGHSTLSRLDNATIRHLSEGYFLGENAALTAYLRQSPDEIALHGLYHTHYSHMSFDEQHEDMRRGLALLRELFPGKKIRYFIPPFNENNSATFEAAHALNMQVLTDDGVHMEEELEDLVLEPGIWYRFHHHRFYHDSRFGALDLNMDGLRRCLTDATRGRTTGYMPTPSRHLEIDLALLRALCEKHGAQQWFYTTARDRQCRAELAAALEWVFMHNRPDARVFEVGCGSANNLIWLAQHGFTRLGGSDIDPKALAVANDMAALLGISIALQQDSFLDMSHVPDQTDVLMALNCTYLHPDFSLASFFRDGARRLTQNGCMVIDQIDASYAFQPGSRYETNDRHLPEAQRRPSEYVHRAHIHDVYALAASLGLRIVRAMPIMGTVPRVVYIVARQGTDCVPRHALSPTQRALRSRYEAIRVMLETDLFDWQWYRAQYVRGPEIVDPLEHYVRWGAAKGYLPFAGFDPDGGYAPGSPEHRVQRIHMRKR